MWTSPSSSMLMTHWLCLRPQPHNYSSSKGSYKLQSFSDSTGLKINFSKSMMVPINVCSGKLDHLAKTFGCQTGSFPFTYLELPMGLTRPKVDDFLPLMTKCEKRLNFISPFLSQASRLELTNSVPTYTMCSIVLPKTVINKSTSTENTACREGLRQMQRKLQRQLGQLYAFPKMRAVWES